jgi:hypothetical protein
MSPSSLKPVAVSIGSAVSIGGSIVAGLVISIVRATVLLGRGLSQEEVTHRLLNDSISLIVSLVVGLGFTVLGGYVAARRARAHEIPNALATGVACTLVGIVIYALGAGIPRPPSWYSLLSYLLVLPFAWLGGAIGRSRNATLSVA